MDKCTFKNIPTLALAEQMLVDAEPQNPGAWIDHSKVAADTAACIAKACKMDEQTAYILGLLHDIGRRDGVKHIQHIFDGYNYLSALGYTDAAKICLTHSFSIKATNAFQGETLDCTNEDLIFLQKFLNECQYTDYDKLIQLCDAIALPHGAVLIEKRLIDVAMRRGIKEDITIRKWQATLDLKSHFDFLAGCNIYTLLPNIKQNTFGF